MRLDPLPRWTERLTLRRLNAGDLPAFQAYRLDPLVGQYQGWSPMSDDEALSFLNDMNAATALAPGEWFQIGIADRQSNTLIGDIGVCVSGDRREAEIGFTLGRSHQGQGLAGEAVREAIAMIFDATDVQRVFAVTDARNGRARKLVSSLGMTQLRTQESIFRGETITEHTFALTREQPPVKIEPRRQVPEASDS
jgi:RimJ/RimL family protein N-acetyltransferase